MENHTNSRDPQTQKDWIYSDFPMSLSPGNSFNTNPARRPGVVTAHILIVGVPNTLPSPYKYRYQHYLGGFPPPLRSDVFSINTVPYRTFIENGILSIYLFINNNNK